MNKNEMELEALDLALLDGSHGAGAARAMAILLRYGQVVGADRFVSITSAHIDGCLYHGPSSIDFAQRFVDMQGRVRVPTTLNVGAVDTSHPGWYQGSADLLVEQTKLNNLYVALGCSPTLTCAPYQRRVRPRFGEHLAWAESNAIVFANSVLGARTDRYGDFTDLCAALTGRVPLAGLHRDENRVPTVLIDVVSAKSSGQPRDLYFAAVGYVLGLRAAGRVPLLDGLPLDASEDELKALGAAAASSGAIAMFHALGITPEAHSLTEATGGRHIEYTAHIVDQDLTAAIRALCPLEIDEPIAAMCLGTPHFSFGEFVRLAQVLAGRRAATGVETYISTSREIAVKVQQSVYYSSLEAFGVRIIVDTCTYFSPVVANGSRAIVTNSAKYAHYGPSNLRRRVGLMTLERCVRSAELGVVAPP